MKKIVQLLIITLLSTTCYSQDLLMSKAQSPYTYYYKLTNKEAFLLISKNKNADESKMLHSKVDSMFTIGGEEPKLPSGHYLKVFANENNVVYELVTLQHFYPLILNNGQDFSLIVIDTLGNHISNAKVWAGCERIKFNDELQVYYRKEQHLKGYLVIQYDSLKIYQRLNNNQVPYSKLGRYFKYKIAPIGEFFKDTYLSIKEQDSRGRWRSFERKWEQRFNRWLDSDLRRRHRDDDNLYKYRKSGYMVLNKPKYLPGDTVKFKAFLYTWKTGKPLNKAVDVYLTEYSNRREGKKIATIQPYTKGGYEYSFVLHDSLDLKLDKTYSLRLSKVGEVNKKYKDEPFKYEDYELDANTLELRTESDELYTGDSLAVYIKGTNDNGFNLQDASVTLTIEPNNVDKFFDKLTYISDETIYSTKTTLLPVGETKIMIPSSIFPKVNMRFTILVEMLTADNELQNEEKSCFYIYEKQEIKDELIADTLNISYFVDNKLTPSKANIIAYDIHYNVIQQFDALLPLKLKLNPYVANYKIKLSDYSTTISMRDKTPDFYIVADRHEKKISCKARNNADLNFNYFIYKKDRLIEKGYGKQLDFVKSEKGKKPYFISIQYLWAGRVVEKNYSVPYDKLKEVVLNVNQPAVIYPGLKTKIDLQVTRKGKPVKNMDITAYSLTSKFNPSLPKFFEIKNNNSYRGQYNSYALKNFEFSKKENLTNQYKSLFAGLDTVEYYHFLYPGDKMYSYSYLIEDSTTQFAPFVVSNGELQPVFVVYVDSKPVYIGLGEQIQPYSFKVSNSEHYVQLRTANHYIDLGKLTFEPNRKTILCVDDTLFNSKAISHTSRKLSNKERDNLYPYLFAFREFLNPKHYGYLKQDDNVFLLSDGSKPSYSYYRNNSYLVSPISPRDVTFVEENSEPLAFVHEQGFEYDFSDRKYIKMRENNYYTDKTYESFSNKKITKPLDSEVLTETKLLNAFKEEETRYYNNLRRTNDRYGNFTNTCLDKCKLEIKLSFYNEDKGCISPLNYLLFKHNDSNFLKVYRGNDKKFHDLEEGVYKLYALFEDDYFVVIDSIKLQPNGTNYLTVDTVMVVSKDDKSKFYNALMNKNIRIEDPSSERQRGELLILQGNYWSEEENNTQIELVQTTRYINGSGISGNIKDKWGEVIIGATIRVKGTGIGTITDFDGNFTLNGLHKGNVVLEVSYIGMKSLEVKLIHSAKGSNNLQLVLKESNVELNDLVVVGYGGSVRKSDMVVYCASSVSSEMLSGAVYGLSVTSNEYSAYLPIQIQTDDLINNFTVPLLDKDFIAASMASSSMRKNFSDYAYWQPTLRTDKQGKASFEVTYPDDVTMWKSYVLGIKPKRKGKTLLVSNQADIKSYKPLMGQLYVPRFLVQGDSATVIGKATNYLSDTINIHTTFTVNDTVKKSKDVEIIYGVNDTLLVSPTSQDSLSIAFKVEKEGGYFDGENRKIPVYPVGLLETKGVFCVLDRDTSFIVSLPKGETSLYMESNELSVLLSEMKHLFDYEHICNEQLASKLKAYLAYDKVCRFKNKEFEFTKDVEKLIDKLCKNKNDQDQWGWWNKSKTVEWISWHVFEALKQAKELGYEVDVLSNEEELIWSKVWLMEKNIIPSEKLKELEQLKTLNATVDYRKYISEIDSLLTIVKKKKKVYEFSTFNHFRLIRLKQLCGIEYSVDSLMAHQKTTMFGSVYYTDRKQNMGYYYSVYNNDKTLTLLAYEILRDQHSNENILRKIRNWFYENRGVNGWTNTYESSKIIDVLLPDLMVDEMNNKLVNVTLNGDINHTVTQFPFELKQTSQTFTVSKTGTAPVFFTAYQKSWNDSPTIKTNDFEITTKFDGNIKTLFAGKPIVLEAKVVVKKDAEYTMIEIPIPAGCSYESKDQPYFKYEVHREFFKNRIAIYCEKFPEGTYTFKIDLVPRYTGSYILNPAKVELMYFPIFNANNGIERIRIR